MAAREAAPIRQRWPIVADAFFCLRPFSTECLKVWV